MAGRAKKTFCIVQENGFFWEFPDSELLQVIVNKLDRDEVRRAAQKDVNILTDLIERNYSTAGIKRIKELGLGSVEKIWQYRQHLIDRFNCRLQQTRLVPAWMDCDSFDYRFYSKTEEFKKELPREYYLEGVVLTQQTPTEQ